MIASVAIKNASVSVPVSPIITCREMSARVSRKVTGINIATIVKINLLFSWLAREISFIKSLIAKKPSVKNEMSANHPVIPGTPSEKFTALKIRTYQITVIMTGKI